MTEWGRYIYAIARGLPKDGLRGVLGLDGRPLDVVVHRDLSAVVSDVDLEEYGEVPLRRNLESLWWLEGVARSHHEVVQQVFALAATVPLRLATICLDDSGVQARLDGEYDALVGALDRVAGRQEWSVKVLASGGPPEDRDHAREGGIGGAEYLRRKKLARDRRSAEREAAARTADRVYDALASVSTAGRRLAVQDQRLSGYTDSMQVNAAYLVDVENAAAFRSQVRALDELCSGVRIDCSGPWPPYSFAMPESADGAVRG